MSLMAERLRLAGLRPTRQWLAIAEVLFGRGDRHVSAEVLCEEVGAKGSSVSLATVYNALHQFRRAGLLRELAVDGTKTYFDTNTSDHSHFFIEETSELVDIPNTRIRVTELPEPPPGTEISHVDVIVRVSRSK
ncbi:MAG: iron response transcriptional regulator IrrA [Pseudomonadota bacterium]